MKLNVVFSSDNNYVAYLKTAIVSLLDNNKSFDDIVIHILSNNINQESQSSILDLVNAYDRKAVFYDLSNIRERLGNLKVETISLSSFSRLFIADILPDNIDKVIYMDCDSLILNSFEELMSLNIDNYLLAGVEDIVDFSFKTRLNIPDKAKYINAGMFLMNLKKFRNENATARIKQFIHNFKGEIPHHDQGTINALFYEQILILHPKYNCMTPFFYLNSKKLKKLYNMSEYYSDKELLEATKSPVFVHFTPFFITRPWVKNCEHPLTSKYLHYYSKVNGLELLEDKRKSKFKVLSFLYKLLPFVLFSKIIRVGYALKK